MFDTVIFDYGNTLCEMGDLAESLENISGSEYAKEIGALIELSIQDLYIPEQVEQPNWIEVWQNAFTHYAVDFDVSIGCQHLRQFVQSGQLYHYSIPLLEQLHNQGTELILLSNVTGDTDIFQNDLRNRGLDKYFHQVIWSSDIGYRKPSKKAFEIAVDLAKNSPSKIIMVGDSEVADIQGAKQVGLRSMRVSDYSGVESSADYVVTRDSIMTQLIHLTSR
ncbi:MULTISPECIES: HAD family hydrolase [Vibrio]|uniref:HAD-IA family hydrolase n=2 Tax=Vibrio TaxID=662 RepID=A0A7X4LPT4_9VIBR|nr:MULTISPECIES: HAD family hydrolase [Vibrio]MBF9002938.1 HAD family hydrolase [Vibrio nitrifigilis]MZI95771.1 HAD-IA family hydrolase [Vibrio eleionomae]